MRTVSSASVRIDRFAATTVSAAPLASEMASSEVSATPCITRDLIATPDSPESASGASGIGAMLAGMGSRPASHITQSATVGQEMVAALEPTTRPKCPARIIVS